MSPECKNGFKIVCSAESDNVVGKLAGGGGIAGVLSFASSVCLRMASIPCFLFVFYPLSFVCTSIVATGKVRGSC